MLRWVILSVVVVVLTAAATLLANLGPAKKTEGLFRVSTKDGPQPKAVVDGPTTYEFGKMSQRSTGKHSWTLRNEGQADLKIWMEGTTCKCTVAKLKDKNERLTIKPGDETTIDLEWQTKETKGEFSQEARIGTSDPNRPMIPLITKGVVHEVIVTIPNDRVVPMTTVSSDEPKKLNVAMFAPDQPKMKLVKIATSKPDFITVTPKPFTEEDLKPLQIAGGYKLEVEVKPGMPLGTFLEEVVIETDNKLEPEVRLKVSGVVTGPISVLPERLRLINVTSSRGGSGEVTLLVRGGKPTKFEVVKKPEKVKVDITPNDTATLKGRYRLTVTVPPGTPTGEIAETIVIKTDNPKASELKIPLSIWVQGGTAG